MSTATEAPPSRTSAHLVELLRQVGKDPSRLVFEDELTELHNRRFLKSYFEHQVRWDTGEDFPLALLVIDLDHFKSINDSHGHAVGDQALTWVASVLNEVAGPRGIPIRYAGDEFMILLPGSDADDAGRVAERLLQRARERPFRVRDRGPALPITMSVGIAAAPRDGVTGRELFQAADTALYHAKHSGRDQTAQAGTVDPARVFPQTALHRLLATRICGRSHELAEVTDALAGLGRGESQFLLFEGGPGMGKTALLKSIHGSLAGQDACAVIRIAADPREEFRPYSLARQLLTRLIESQESRGGGTLADLAEQDLRYLSLVLPNVAPDRDFPVSAEGVQGPALRSVLTSLVPRLVDHRPFVLVVDDLHLADAETLRLFLDLLSGGGTPMVLVASAMDSASPQAREPLPLERVLASADGSIVRRFPLGPLTVDDVRAYLDEVFPKIRLAEGFVQEIARVTGGNPLFLNEVLRKLVADGRVVFEDLRWVGRSLQPGDLPASLEEVVRERISALDPETRDLLERASALGDESSLSVLSGSAATDEGRMLDVMDRAQALGLVRMDFDSDDEMVQFTGKQIRDITYDGIDAPRRTHLHEQIGEYAERLYERGLLSSPSMVAWQYRQAGNPEKTERYDRLQREQTRRLLAPEEIAALPAEVVEEEVELEAPLDDTGVALLPRVIRCFMKGVRDIQLYPPGSATILRSVEDLHDAIRQVLETNERLTLGQSKQVLLVNGQRVVPPGGAGQADAFVEILARAEIQSLGFGSDLDAGDVRSLVEEMGGLKPDRVSRGHWRTFQEERGLKGLTIEQVRYSRVVRRKAPGASRGPAIQDVELDDDDLRQIPDILRAFHSASKAAQLYPLDALPVARAIEGLHRALQGVLGRRNVLTLAWTDDSLIANGTRVDTSASAGLVDGFIGSMTAAGLGSVTWTEALTASDLAAFVAAVRDAPAGAGREHWDAFAAAEASPGLVLNARQYSTDMVQQVLEWGEDDAALFDSTDPMLERARSLEGKPMVTLLESLPEVARELMVKGQPEMVGRLVRGMLVGLRDEEPMIRDRALRACRSLLDTLTLGLQQDLTELVVDPILGALENETDTTVLSAFGGLLNEMANLALRFGDWDMASRILLSLRERRLSLDRTGGRSGATASQLDRTIEPPIQMLLVDVFRSREPTQVAQAAKVLSGAGRAALPVLLDVIRREPELRVRSMAAALMAEEGWAGPKEIKRALATDAVVEHRIRLLEVADQVTQDLGDELRFALSSDDRGVRDEGFRLFQRLKRDDLVDLMVPYAADDDTELARTAIQALATLGTAAAVAGIVAAQRSTRNPEAVVACCQALGHAGSLAGVDALVRVLEERKRRLFGYRWPEPVRAAAAAALAQVGHPRAAAALSRLVDDPHPWVRDLARGAAAAPAGA